MVSVVEGGGDVDGANVGASVVLVVEGERNIPHLFLCSVKHV